MAVFLSPGVFAREVDVSVIPAAGSGITPAFIGTAKKGPINDPTFVSTSAQFIDTFGEPFPDSNLGYAAISYMEEGNRAWVLRVGVECELGQVSDLADICLDTSGAKVEGWGRVPLFTGIDFGTIELRAPTTAAPVTFHDASVDNINYTDIDVSSTDGSASATLTFVDPTAYIGAIDDVYVILITSPPLTDVLDGAEYSIIRQSDGATIQSGTIVDSDFDNTSDSITLGSGTDATGLDFSIVVTGASPLEQDDTFTFEVHPDNRNFAFSVNGAVASVFSFSSTSYTDPDVLVDAFNLLAPSEDYLAVEIGGEVFVRTRTAGDRIQLVGSSGSTEPDTEAWALEVGITKWTWDNPRSYLVGSDVGPFVITTQNDKVALSVVGSATTQIVETTLAVSAAKSVAALATEIHASGVVLGVRLYDAFALQTSDTEFQLLVQTSTTNLLDQLKALADFSHIETLRFTQEVGIPFPYTRAYRGFSDSRVDSPVEGVITPSTPASCEDDPSSDECVADTAYFAGIVGFAVAKYAGTWIDDFTLTLENFNNEAARYSILIKDLNGLDVSRIDDLSFDPDDERYIANVVNEGSSIGGQNGNEYIQWVERSANIGASVIRQPSTLSAATFAGSSDGIPASAEFSSELDRAIIGNPVLSTGLNAFSNPDTIDISLLLIPGNSSGAVIGQALQLCQGRGDCLYIVDPPFGLRPQQVVDWHNGMLLDDLTAAINSSYGALYWSWVKRFDQFNDNTEIFVPPSGYIASVFARTERVGEMWFAPAGLNRGRLLTALDIEYNPTLGERDLMYGFNNAVNPIVNFPQDGITVWGQRTLQRKDSALDRVNVRMLLIFLKKALIPLLRNFVFEPNDRFLWGQVRNAIEPTLNDVAARRGLTGYKVVVDETNNTPERQDRNELWVSVFVKPTRTAEFVVLNLIVMRTEQSFASQEVLSAGGVVGI